MKRDWLNSYLSITKGDGIEFERFLIQLIEEYYDVKSRQIGGANDKGVDIIIENIGIQAKFYSTSLGIKPIQEIYTGIQYHGLEKGLVITNSTYNKNAYEMAKSTEVILVDGNAILATINNLNNAINYKKGEDTLKIGELLKLDKIQETKELTEEQKYINLLTKKITNEKRISKITDKVNSLFKYNNTERRSQDMELIRETLTLRENNELMKLAFSSIISPQVYIYDREGKKKIIKLVEENTLKFNPEIQSSYLLEVDSSSFLRINSLNELFKSEMTDEELIKKLKIKRMITYFYISIFVFMAVYFVFFL